MSCVTVEMPHHRPYVAFGCGLCLEPNAWTLFPFKRRHGVYHLHHETSTWNSKDKDDVSDSTSND